jgi:acetyl esterase
MKLSNESAWKKGWYCRYSWLLPSLGLLFQGFMAMAAGTRSALPAPAMLNDSLLYSVHTYSYKKTADSLLQLDVYTPLNISQPAAAIILFHGGSWIAGDKSQLQWQCGYFARQGMIAITANYRLLTATDNRKQVCIMDAKSAVRWVKSQAAVLHIDTGRIILGGASAGGHLATMALMNRDINDPSDDTTVSVNAKALVLYNPAYSITEDSSIQPFQFADAHFPPTILFFGSRDKWKPAGDSLYSLLRSHSVRSERWIANGEVHGFFNKAPYNRFTCERAQGFLVACGLLRALPAADNNNSLLQE